CLAGDQHRAYARQQNAEAQNQNCPYYFFHLTLYGADAGFIPIPHEEQLPAPLIGFMRFHAHIYIGSARRIHPCFRETGSKDLPPLSRKSQKNTCTLRLMYIYFLLLYLYNIGNGV